MKKSILPLVVIAMTGLSAKPAPPPQSAPTNAQPTYVYINPEQVPEHDWDTDLFGKNKQCPSAHAEFIYWKAMEGAMTYALSADPTDPIVDVGAIGKYKSGSFNIDPGFRIGLSYFRAPHYWEGWIQYTRMTSHGFDKVAATDNHPIIPVWETPTFGGAAEPVLATSSLHLNYNVIDTYFNRIFQPNPHLRLKLLGGVSGGWINQTTNISYTDELGLTDDVQLKWSFWGAGFRVGFAGDWYWFDDFYMTSKFTFAGLVGPYQSSAKQETLVQVVRNSQYNDSRGVLNAQLLMGPSWQKTFQKTRVEVFAGCEFNFWNNLQEVYHSAVNGVTDPKVPLVNTGNLSFIGLTTRVTATF
jgi:hypothetical protein